MSTRQDTPHTEIDLPAFIDALPKGEHHLHLEGATPWARMRETDPERFTVPPDSWAENFRFDDFGVFETLVLDYVVPWLNTPERYGLTAREIVAARRAENVQYLEVSIAGVAIEALGLDFAEVAAAIKQAVPADFDLRLFVGLHHIGFQRHEALLADILDCADIDGIDLHGPEDYPLSGWLPEYWNAARAAGKRTKAHAGELAGAFAVRDAIEGLGVEKVQHGIRAIEDPEVVALAVERGVSFDVCPISNVKLKAVPELAAHPLMRLDAAGVVCTINTDDPFIFGNRLRDDYLATATVLGATAADLARFAKNSLVTADLPPLRCAALCAQVDAVLEKFTSDH